MRSGEKAGIESTHLSESLNVTLSSCIIGQLFYCYEAVRNKWDNKYKTRSSELAFSNQYCLPFLQFPFLKL